MPLRADARRSIERVAQGAALALLAWLLARALFPGDGTAPVRTDSATLGVALRRWSTAAAPTHVHARFDAGPGPAYRDWLAALAGAGARVTWQAGSLRPVAATADPIADPSGGTRILVAAPERARILLGDQYGVLDSVASDGSGAAFIARSGPQVITAEAGATAARSAVQETLRLGRVLVLGRAGWEAKFVVASLEERGWGVDARLLLSPKGNVRQGAGAGLDTARYAAVIVLDSSALRSATGLAAYVRSGGGAILAGTGAAATASGLGASHAGALLAAEEPFDTAAAEPRRSLAFRPIAPADEEITLDRRGSQVAVVARRVERGRVVRVSYEDTWRWRMAGRDGSAERYRTWWAGLVAGVAYSGRTALPPGTDRDEMPLQSLVDRLGPARAEPPAGSASRGVSDGWLFGAVLGLLLLSWASRRLRGAA